MQGGGWRRAPEPTRGVLFWAFCVLERCGDAERSLGVVLLLAAPLEDGVAGQPPFCRRPPCWRGAGVGGWGGKRVGKGRLDLRYFTSCFNRRWSLWGRVSPSQGRISGSCLNQASLCARAGPGHAALFLVRGSASRGCQEEKLGGLRRSCCLRGAWLQAEVWEAGREAMRRVKPGVAFGTAPAELLCCWGCDPSGPPWQPPKEVGRCLVLGSLLRRTQRLRFGSLRSRTVTLGPVRLESLAITRLLRLPPRKAPAHPNW